MAIRGEYRLLLFLAICQILRVYGTLKISYLSYIASIHKSMLVSSNKWRSRASRPLGLFFFALIVVVIYFSFIYIYFSLLGTVSEGISDDPEDYFITNINHAGFYHVLYDPTTYLQVCDAMDLDITVRTAGLRKQWETVLYCTQRRCMQYVGCTVVPLF